MTLYDFYNIQPKNTYKLSFIDDKNIRADVVLDYKLILFATKEVKLSDTLTINILVGFKTNVKTYCRCIGVLRGIFASRA